jgi:hypothetical protein
MQVESLRLPQDPMNAAISEETKTQSRYALEKNLDTASPGELDCSTTIRIDYPATFRGLAHDHGGGLI